MCTQEGTEEFPATLPLDLQKQSWLEMPELYFVDLRDIG